jgi:hypothetical protein
MKTLLVGVLVSFAYIAFAGDESRKGTTGADQLLIPVGARSIGSAGAFLASARGVEAIYYNPAGLAFGRGAEAMFSYMNYLADINLSYFAGSVSFEGLGTFGLSYKSLHFGEIPVTTFESPDGTGSTFSPGFYTLGFSFARPITDRVSAGATVKLVNESILSTSATGVGIDFGVQYKFQSDLSLGVTIKNIGSNMKYTGTDLLTRTGIPGSANGSPDAVYSPDTEPFQMPSYFELSVAYETRFNEMNSLMLGATFRNNNSLEDQGMVGAEYQLFNTIFFRAGYEGALKNSDRAIYGMNFGAGFDYQVEGGFQVCFDYAFRSVKEFPSDNHIFTLKLGF